MPDTTPQYPDAAEVARVKRDVTGRLLANPSVTMVGLGAKLVGGRPIGVPAIKVFVRDKRPAELVPPEELIPAEIDGVPTDVEPGGTFTPLADPTGTIDVAHTDRDRDPDPIRPLKGGARLTRKDSHAAGTLGCMLWDSDPAKHDVGYALTNQHVVATADTDPPEKDKSRVGQPHGNDSSTGCSNDIIGVWAGGGHDDDRDEAAVRLLPGMKWQAEILEIGPVTGAHTVTSAEAGSGTYKVRKRGGGTGLTGGVVLAVEATAHAADNRIIIRPFPDPKAGPDDITWFAFDGDSGSAVVNADGEVVGLVRQRAENGEAAAIPIDHVLDRLKTIDKLDLRVATATATDNPVHVMPGGATAVVPPEVVAQFDADPRMRAAFQGTGDQAPVGRPWFTDVPPPPGAFAATVDELRRSATGRLLVGLWQRHRTELIRLLNQDRRLTLVWHRGGGAALTQLLLRMLSRPEQRLPRTVHGEPLAVCTDRLYAEFARCASPPLRADLARVHAALPDLAGLSYAEIIDALARGAEH